MGYRQLQRGLLILNPPHHHPHDPPVNGLGLNTAVQDLVLTARSPVQAGG
jgi:hypothetical protein